MNIRAARIGSAVIIRLEGRMSAETGGDWIGTALDAAVSGGTRHVVCDLGGVSQMDCTGIGHLLTLRACIHGARRTMAIGSVEARQARLLDAAGLMHVFRVFPDSRAAVVALGLGETAQEPKGRWHPPVSMTLECA